MATYTVTNLLNRASTLLQDPTNIRWPQAELVDWLNDGQREIAAFKPNAFVKNESFTLAAGSKQVLPAAGISLVDVPRNSNGNAIRVVSREILDAQIPDWHTKTGTAVKHYTYTAHDPKTFYVYPAVSGGSVDIIYVSAPTDASIGGNITLDDIYAAALLNYVMYRAYSKDAEYAQNPALAKAYYDAFQAQLGGKATAEGVSNPNQTMGAGGFNPNLPGSNR